MKITNIEYEAGETMSPIGFAKAVIDFWHIEDIDGVADDFKEMVDHLQVKVRHLKKDEVW